MCITWQLLLLFFFLLRIISLRLIVAAASPRSLHSINNYKYFYLDLADLLFNCYLAGKATFSRTFWPSTSDSGLLEETNSAVHLQEKNTCRQEQRQLFTSTRGIGAGRKEVPDLDDDGDG